MATFIMLTACNTATKQPPVENEHPFAKPSPPTIRPNNHKPQKYSDYPPILATGKKQKICDNSCNLFAQPAIISSTC